MKYTPSIFYFSFGLLHQMSGDDILHILNWNGISSLYYKIKTFNGENPITAGIEN